MKESDLLHSSEGIGGNERISMSDILQSIDAEKFDNDGVKEANKEKKVAKNLKSSDGTINTTKLRK